VILDRYIAAEVLKPLLLIGGILVVIFVGYSSGRYLAEAASGLLDIETVARLIFLRAIIALEVLLPVALYLSIVAGLGRLHADSEIIALTSCGIGTGRLVLVALRLALPLALVVAALSLYARPWAYEQSYWIKAKADADIDVEKLVAGTFYETEHRSRAIFVQDIERGSERRLEGVFLRSKHGDVLRVIHAASGRQRIEPDSGRRALVLRDVHAYEISPGGRRDKLGRFGELVLWLKEPDPVTVGFKRKAAATADLMDSADPAEIAELQWRCSTALSTLLLAVLAVLVSGMAQGLGRSTKAIVAILVYAVYYNLSGVSKNWVENATVGPVPGIWWVHALLAVVLVLLFTQPARAMRRRARLAEAAS